jgi:hypothetical protein
MVTLTKGIQYGQKIVLLEILVKLSYWIQEFLFWSRLEVRELCVAKFQFSDRYHASWNKTWFERKTGQELFLTSFTNVFPSLKVLLIKILGWKTSLKNNKS